MAESPTGSDQDITAGLAAGPIQVSPGTRIIGTYEITDHINTGGMGEVYRGINIFTEEPVAIKIVLPALAHDRKILSLFQKEATVLNRLAHDAIVRYHLFTIDPALGRPCLVMEFVDGVPLYDRMEQGRMPEEEVARLLHRLASGLAAAHRAGVVHRDLSPDNVILPEGLVENAKIIDFGIAKSAKAGGATLIGDLFAGKYAYVAPEQLGLYEGNVTAQADVFSLGLVAAGVARGAAIDMGDNPATAVQSRMRPPELDGIPEGLAEIIGWMVQPDPAARPQGMEEVIAHLEAHHAAALGLRTAPPRSAAPRGERTASAPPASSPPRSAAPGSAPPEAAPPEAGPPGSVPPAAAGTAPPLRTVVADPASLPAGASAAPAPPPRPPVQATEIAAQPPTGVSQPDPIPHPTFESVPPRPMPSTEADGADSPFGPPPNSPDERAPAGSPAPGAGQQSGSGGGLKWAAVFAGLALLGGGAWFAGLVPGSPPGPEPEQTVVASPPTASATAPEPGAAPEVSSPPRGPEAGVSATRPDSAAPESVIAGTAPSDSATAGVSLPRQPGPEAVPEGGAEAPGSAVVAPENESAETSVGRSASPDVAETLALLAPEPQPRPMQLPDLAAAPEPRVRLPDTTAPHDAEEDPRLAALPAEPPPPPAATDPSAEAVPDPVLLAARLDSQRSWVVAYADGPGCSYLQPAAVPADPLPVTGFAAQPSALASFAEAFDAAHGTAPDLTLRRVTPRQCGTLGFLQGLRADDAGRPGPELSLVLTPAGAGEIAGRIEVGEGGDLWLVAIDADGMLLDVSDRLDGPAFRLPLDELGGDTEGPLLLMALASAEPLQVVAALPFGFALEADGLLDFVRSEIVERGISISAALALAVGRP